MMSRLPSRAALLVPLLSMGLLVSGPGVGLTRADTPPAACGLADGADPDDGAVDTLLMLSAILPDDVDPALVAAPPRPGPMSPEVPVPLGAPMPPGGPGVPEPMGANLHPPDPALLNLEPIVAARQLRESLSEQQQADLRAVLAKHQAALQQARPRLPELAAGPKGNGPVTADREPALNQASTDVQRISDQIDQEIEPILTPAQRALLRKARPERLGAEHPESSKVVPAESAPDC